MKFVARSNQKSMFPQGHHKATIKSIAPVNAKASDLYKDLTPQLEVLFESETDSIRSWYNLKGYQKNEDGTYKIDKKGNRIVDADKTADAISIFEKLGIHAGIPSGTEFELADLLGEEVGIMVVKDEKGKVKVKYTTPADRVEAAIAVSSEESDDL